MNEELAKKLIMQIKEVFDRHNLEFWLDHGTLLGAVREGRFISYDDNDVDLCGWAHKITQKQIENICRELSQQGLNVYYAMDIGVYCITIRKREMSVGFRTYVLEKDKAINPREFLYGSGPNTFIARQIYWLSEIFARRKVGKINIETIRGLKRIVIFLAVILTSIFPRHLKRKLAAFLRLKAAKIRGEFGIERVPARFFLELENLAFYGKTFKVPNNAEEYLELIYGPNWKVPLRGWHYYHPDKALATGLEFVNRIWNYK